MDVDVVLFIQRYLESGSVLNLTFVSTFEVSRAMAGESKRSTVPVLDTENYEIWAVRLEALLMKKGCWEAVEGFGPYIHVGADGLEREIIDETAFPAAEVKRRTRLNQQASAIIIEYVSDAFLDDVTNVESAKEMWESLEEVCSTYDVFQEIIFLKEMVTTEKNDEESMMQYMGTIQNYLKKLKKCGLEFPDRAVAAFYLMGLPRNTYAEFIRSIYRTNEGDVTSKFVRSQLLLEEKRMKSDENGEHKALRVKKGFNTTARNVRATNSPEQQHARRFDNQNSPFSESRKFVCYRCGHEGHIARDCRTPVSDFKNEREGQKDEPCVKDEPEKKSSASIIKRGFKALCTQQIKGKSDGTWMLDSAASDHMTPCRELLEEFAPYDGEVTIGDGKTLQIKGIGSALIPMSDECGGWNIKLSEVLYIPGLTENLISEGKLDEKKMTIVKRNGVARILDGEEEIFRSYRVGSLYYVTTRGGISIDNFRSKTNRCHKMVAKAHLVIKNQLEFGEVKTLGKLDFLSFGDFDPGEVEILTRIASDLSFGNFEPGEVKALTRKPKQKAIFKEAS